MAQRIEKKEEYILTRKQFEARKEAGTLVIGATYHITDDPTPQDIIDGVEIAKKAEQDALSNNIVETYRRKDDSYSAKETQDKLDTKVDKFDGSQETGDNRFTVYGQRLGEQVNVPFSSNAKEFVLAQYASGGNLKVAEPRSNDDATTKQYVDNADNTLQTNIDNVDKKLETFILKDFAIDHNTDNVSITNTYVNLNTAVEMNDTKNINLVNESTAGLMSTGDYKTLRDLSARVGNLEGKTTRLLYTEKTDPSAEDIQNFIDSFTNEHLESEYKSPYEGLTVVIDETFHIWRYYENDNIGWRDDGVDSVHQFTNETKGIILGSTQEGKIYAETDGTGSVNGWSNLVNNVETNARNIEQNKQDISTNANNIQSINERKINGHTFNQDVTLNMTDIEDNENYVKFTDYAVDKGSAGIVYTDRGTYGVGASTKGLLFIDAASESQIKDKQTTYRPITPNNLDYAVKVGLTTNKQEWSDDEKQAARDLIGAGTVDDISSKVDIIEGTGVYFQSNDTTTLKPIGQNVPESGQIVSWTTNKTIKAADPIADDDVVTKSYMEDNAGKIDTISVNGTNITADENKNIDITIPVTDVKVNNISIVKNKTAEINIGDLSFSDQEQLAIASDFTKDITLHKIAATGKYSDLLAKPNIIDNLNSESSEDLLSARQGNELRKLIQAIPKATSYENISSLITVLNNANNQEFNVGHKLFIQDTNVPDYWVYSVENSNVNYSYIDDKTFIDYISENGTLQVGYYKIAVSEADKVDFTDYATRTWVEEEIKEVEDTISVHINETTSKLSQLDNKVDKRVEGYYTIQHYSDETYTDLTKTETQNYINEFKSINYEDTHNNQKDIANNYGLEINTRTEDSPTVFEGLNQGFSENLENINTKSVIVSPDITGIVTINKSDNIFTQTQLGSSGDMLISLALQQQTDEEGNAINTTQAYDMLAGFTKSTYMVLDLEESTTSLSQTIDSNGISFQIESNDKTTGESIVGGINLSTDGKAYYNGKEIATVGEGGASSMIIREWTE